MIMGVFTTTVLVVGAILSTLLLRDAEMALVLGVAIPHGILLNYCCSLNHVSVLMYSR